MTIGRNLKKRSIANLTSTVLLIAIAGSSQASTGVLTAQATSGTADAAFTGIRVAEVGDLKPSTLRRLRFYSDKVREALFELTKEDQAASSGAALNSDTTNTLRVNIERLLDSGEKAGLTIDQVAEFFVDEMKSQFSGEIPQLVKGANGELDVLPLFESVAKNKGAVMRTNDEAAYFAKIQAEGAAAQAATGQSATDNAAPAQLATPETPPIATDRDPAVQAYWDRLEMVGDQRSIIVVAGDTLAAYALAFYGDPLEYRRILAANESLAGSPNLLEVGQRIVIP